VLRTLGGLEFIILATASFSSDKIVTEISTAQYRKHVEASFVPLVRLDSVEPRHRDNETISKEQCELRENYFSKAVQIKQRLMRRLD
jgi:hypothetical protein